MIKCYNPDLLQYKCLNNPGFCGNEDTYKMGDKAKHVLNTSMLKNTYVVEFKFDKV